MRSLLIALVLALLAPAPAQAGCGILGFAARSVGRVAGFERRQNRRSGRQANGGGVKGTCGPLGCH